jgi:integrase
MRGKISKRTVDALELGLSLADTEVKGFIAHRLPSGVIRYGYRYRNRAGRQRWYALGLHGELTPEQARRFAKTIAGQVAEGRDPATERTAKRAAAHAKAGTTVNVVLDAFLERHVQSLRSAREVKRIFKIYVRPAIGSRSIYELKRRDINQMLDAVEDRGPVMADRTLGWLRKAFGWWALRDDGFNSPIVRGMARTKPSARRRQRVLSDAELRAVWRAAEPQGDLYGDFVRFVLLTAARRTEAAGAKRCELVDGDWIVPTERYKTGTELVIPLSKAAQAVLAGRPKLGEAGFLFTVDGKAPLSGFSKFKLRFDRAVLAELRREDPEAELPNWRLHDLRRCARSLLSRAGMPSDHAERCLGHAVAGVRGTYDRHAYVEEKRRAFEALAALVTRIVNPAADNVRPLFPEAPTSA